MGLSDQNVVNYSIIRSALGAYNQLLRQKPVLTKSITSGIISALGPLISQIIQGQKISPNVIRSFLVFGCCFTGPITHHFYSNLDRVIPGARWYHFVARMCTERLIFAPMFVLLTLYLLARLQGNSHQKTLQDINSRYFSCLLANWKIWTIPQLINIGLVPREYRVLFANLVALVWNVYLAAAASQSPPKSN